MSTIEILEAARARIADKAHWTTKFCARDACGDSVDPKSPDAVCWCAFGALLNPSDDEDFSAVDALKCAARELYGARVTDVNDNIGHEAVLKVYDLAIANEKGAVTA